MLRPPDTVEVPSVQPTPLRWLGWVSVLLMLVAFAIRVARLGGASYWGDEMVSVVYGQLPFSEIAGWAAENDPHPPLYYLILHGWMLLTGVSEYATRYFSVLMSVLAVPLAGAVALKICGRGLALTTMLLIATNPLQIVQARDARMYPLLVALTLAATLVLVHAWRKGWSRGTLISYVLIGAASLYTHYYAGLVLLAHGIFALLPVIHLRSAGHQPVISWPDFRRFVLPFLGAAATITILFLPWMIPGLAVVTQYEGYANAGGIDAGAPLPTALRIALDTFSFGPWVPMDPLRSAVEVFFVTVLFGGAFAMRGRRAWLLLLCLLVPVLTVWLASFSRPIFLPRYLIAATPAFYLLLAAGIVAVVRRPVGRLVAPVLMVGLLAVQGVGTSMAIGHPDYGNADWRGAARFVTARQVPTDGIIYGHDGIRWLFGFYHNEGNDEYLPPFDAKDRTAEIDAALRAFTRDHDRVWFVPWWQSDADVAVERWLNANAYKAINRWLGPIRLTMFASPTTMPQPTPVSITYDDTLRLTGWAIDRTEASPGDVVRLALNWQAVDDLDQDVKVLIKLVDDRSRAMATIDRLPRDGTTIGWAANERVTDRYGLLIPPGTPPGRYHLDVDLYEAETGERLTPDQGNQAGYRVILGDLTIRETDRPFTLDAIEANQRFEERFAGALLAGATIDYGNRRPGDLVQAILYWVVDGPTTPVRLVLGDPDRPIGTVDVTPEGTGVVRQDVFVRIRPGIASGQYDLWARSDRAAVQLGSLNVVAPPPLPTPATPAHTLEARLGDLAVLEGVTVRNEGNSLTVTNVWRAERETDRAYAVFVHLLDADGKLVSQSDSIPAAGAAPTTAWTVGQRIGDTHRLAANPAGVRLAIGLYDPLTFRRLPVGSGDAVIVPLNP